MKIFLKLSKCHTLVISLKAEITVVITTNVYCGCSTPSSNRSHKKESRYCHVYHDIIMYWLLQRNSLGNYSYKV